ncbi:MAG TPA: hypothetical protein DCG59_07195, partial [Leclercia adecarboxylata]|nr:hypothetical protein [Leclercia adecarboxylata]
MHKLFVSDDISGTDLEPKQTATLIKRALQLMFSLLAVLFIVAIIALLTIVRNINDSSDKHSAMLLEKA